MTTRLCGCGDVLKKGEYICATCEMLVQMRIEENAIIQFCDEVDALAQKLMMKDGKVSGKHYAAMRRLIKEKFDRDWGR